MQAELCRHIQISGLQCRAVALKDNLLCYFHARLEGTHSSFRKFGRNHTPQAFRTWIKLLPLEDHESIQLAISKVVNVLALGLVDERLAKVVLYGLQIASANAHRMRVGHRPGKVIREAFGDDSLGDFSPHFAPAGRTRNIPDPPESEWANQRAAPTDPSPQTPQPPSPAPDNEVPATDNEQRTPDNEERTTQSISLSAFAAPVAPTSNLEPRTPNLEPGIQSTKPPPMPSSTNNAVRTPHTERK